MVWINCGLDSCGLDGGWNSSRVWGNYYILQNSWFGSIVAWIYGAWISMKVVKGLRKLLHPPELMVWINCGLDSCGLDKHESYQGFELLHIEWGASPPNPPGFMALRATTHSARRSLWIALLWQFVQFNICSIVPVILFRCICPVGIWSIKYLFRYPLAQLTFCSIDFCSTDFLFNWFLFNWHFVQLFCSIVLVQFGLGESTCHLTLQYRPFLMEKVYI